MDTINNNFFSTPLLRILNGSDLNEVGLQIFLLQLFYRKLIFFFKTIVFKIHDDRLHAREKTRNSHPRAIRLLKQHS